MAATSDPQSTVELPAQAAPRAAAFVLDLLTGAALIVLFGIVAWLLWLVASHGGTRQPSDGAIYGGIVMLTLALPVWAIASVFAWSHWGQTPGEAAMALRVIDAYGNPPGPLRALLRTVLIGIIGIVWAVSPLVVIGVLAAAVQHTLPPLLGAALLLPVALAAIDALAMGSNRRRQTLHDWISGTRVVRTASIVRTGRS